MRFTDRIGERIDVYQAATQLTDESDQSYPLHINALLDAALGPAGYFGVITANMHTDAVASAGSEAIVGSAQARGVPVITARQLLTWLDGRNGSSFGNLTWNGTTTLGFTVSALAGARNLQGLIPLQVGGRTLVSITRNGLPITFASETIKGMSYARFPATTGTYGATYQ